jgi:four helix bundle protein
LVRAADSIASNLSEGFGRYHYREAINFCYYSRGSLFETKTWLVKAKNRNLLEKPDYELFMQQVDDIGIRLNNYIKSIGKTS